MNNAVKGGKTKKKKPNVFLINKTISTCEESL